MQYTKNAGRAFALPFAALLLLIAGGSAEAREPVPLAKRLDAYLKAAERHEQFSGTVLLARDGRPVFTRSYGLANRELGVRNTPGTVYRIASITKQFTALAIMQLQEQGRLKLDDPACRYLDDCPAAWAPITIRHLLTHRSGIPNYSSLPDWDERLSRRDYTPTELVALFRDLPLGFAPGTRFAYSNSGYHLLGLVIERTSGLSWGAFVQRRILAPLGMDRSGYAETRALLPNRASGYYSLGTSYINAPIISPTVGYAAGGLHSTVGDMLLWDRALEPGRLVSRASLDAIFTPVLNGYGLGWRIGEKFGRREVDHSGSDNGFSSYIIRFSKERVTAIVLSNSDRASAGRVGNAMAGLALGETVAIPSAHLRELMWDRIVAEGVASAVRLYTELKREPGPGLDFGEPTLVELGYDLFEARRLDEAEAIFRFNLTLFPASTYSRDGLADIARMRGDSAAAIRLFEESLKLDPSNDYASAALAKLRAAPR